MWDARTPFLAGEVAICGQAPLSMFASVLLPLAVSELSKPTAQFLTSL